MQKNPHATLLLYRHPGQHLGDDSPSAIQIDKAEDVGIEGVTHAELDSRYGDELPRELDGDDLLKRG